MPDTPIPHHDFESFVTWLRSMQTQRFYGSIVLTWRGGEMVMIEKRVVWKPGERLG